MSPRLPCIGSVLLQAGVTHAHIDGAFKIERNQYALVSVGSHSVEIVKGEARQVYRAYAYELVESESGVGTVHLLHGVQTVAKQLFDLDWVVEHPIGDRSEAVSTIGWLRARSQH
jgi:hypothetical protein